MCVATNVWECFWLDFFDPDLVRLIKGVFPLSDTGDSNRQLLFRGLVSPGHGLGAEALWQGPSCEDPPHTFSSHIVA
jgi:hypothetical protein